MGMDKAFDYSNHMPTIILSGYSTAIGGGIIASGKPPIEIFKSKKRSSVILSFYLAVAITMYLETVFASFKLI